MWDKAFSKSCGGRSVQQTSDGGYIITTGMCRGIGQGSDIWLIKTDNRGYELWNKTFAGFGGWASGNEVRETTDGGYVILYDCYLIKTDSNGNELWNRNYAAGYGDSCASVRQTMDEGYIITGSTGAFRQQDALLIKTDVGGNELWRKTFGKNTQFHIYDDEATFSIEQTDDGGYIMTGFTDSYGAKGTVHIWLIKTDADGNELWNRIFGEELENSAFEGTSVQQTKDGGYVITGWGRGIHLIKTDSSGQQLWWKTFDGDRSYSVQQTIDGGYILAGFYGQNVLLIKTDANGNVSLSP